MRLSRRNRRAERGAEADQRLVGVWRTCDLVALAILQQPLDQSLERASRSAAGRSRPGSARGRRARQVVGPRRLRGGALQRGEHPVERAQHLAASLRPVDPGVMRHLVVAEEGGVDRRNAAEQVGQEHEAARLLQQASVVPARMKEYFQCRGRPAARTSLRRCAGLPPLAHDVDDEEAERCAPGCRGSRSRGSSRSDPLAGIANDAVGAEAVRRHRRRRRSSGRRRPAASRPVAGRERLLRAPARSRDLLETIRRPAALSHQRKAGMPSLSPSRMPAWLAEVCDERSGSQ